MKSALKACRLVFCRDLTEEQNKRKKKKSSPWAFTEAAVSTKC